MIIASLKNIKYELPVLKYEHDLWSVIVIVE